MRDRITQKHSFMQYLLLHMSTDKLIEGAGVVKMI